MIDEQMAHLLDDADDASIRALVSENAGVGTEHRHAQAHADAMAAHRAHVIADIRSHELRQDDLLDALARR